MSPATKPAPGLKQVREPGLRARLLEAIESLPEERAAMWTQERPLGGPFAALPGRDHHHAEVVKRARAETPPQPRTP